MIAIKILFIYDTYKLAVYPWKIDAKIILLQRNYFTSEELLDLQLKIQVLDI